MRLDDELAQALARKAAPDGFATRVLERVQGSSAARARRWRRQAWGGAVAASLALLISTGAWLHRQSEERLERAQGEAAKKLVLVAMRIASEKTNLARDRVRDTDSRAASKEKSHEELPIQN